MVVVVVVVVVVVAIFVVGLAVVGAAVGWREPGLELFAGVPGSRVVHWTASCVAPPSVGLFHVAVVVAKGLGVAGGPGVGVAGSGGWL